MFENVLTTSPGFSLQHQQDGHVDVTVKILACRPVDASSYPADAQQNFLDNPLGAGSAEATCSHCGCDVILGPRQAIAHDLEPENFLVACLACTVLLTIIYNEGEEPTVTNLGG